MKAERFPDKATERVQDVGGENVMAGGSFRSVHVPVWISPGPRTTSRWQGVVIPTFRKCSLEKMS